MSYYDCEETDRAVQLYFQRVRRIAGPDAEPRIPSRHTTEREGDVITIRSGDDVLDRYRVLPSGILKRIPESDGEEETPDETVEIEGVSLVAHDGNEDQDDDPFACAFKFQSLFPLAVDRPRGRDDLVFISTFQYHLDSRGFQLTLTDVMARKLVADLTRVLCEHD